MTEELETLSCKELINRLLELFETQNEEEVDECLDWFLFTYSPEHAFSLVQANAEALKDNILLDIVMTKVREIYEPEIFLETMNVLSSIEGHEQEIAKSGACRAVVTMMGRDIHNARSQSLGCKVLANLCHDPEVCEWLGKVKGVSRVIEALRRHQTSLDVSIECMRCMANMTYRCKPNKDIMVSEHAIDAISDTMGMHKTNVKLVNAALRALRNIVTLDSVLELQQHTLIHEVIAIMNDHSAISEIQVHGVWILIGLMSGKSETKRHISEQGSLDTVLRAMEVHKLDAQVQLAGATSLGLLSKVAAHRQQIAKGSGSNQTGIRILLDALQNHREFVPVQRAALKALFRLSFNKVTRDQLAQHNAVTEIVESMKANPDSGPLQRMAIICLLQLAKTPALRDRVQHDAVAFMIQARNKFMNIPHVHTIAHIAVESMISNTSNISVSAGTGASEVITPTEPVTVAQSPRRMVGDSDTQISAGDAQAQIELRNLKTTLNQKDKQVEVLEESIGKLESQLSQGKGKRGKKAGEKSDGHKDDLTFSGDEDKLVAQLKQLKESLTQDLKKAKAVHESFKLKLKEEEAKLQHIRAKKKQLLEEKKARDEKDPAELADSSAEESERERDTDKNDHGKPKRTSSTKGKTTKVKKEVKSPRSSSTEESDETGNSGTTSQDSDTTEPGAGQELPPDDSKKGSSNRGLKRNTPSRSDLNSNEEIVGLKEELRALQARMQQKEKDVKHSHEEKNKLDQQVKQLNVDLKGAHILIQTLQKESVNQNAARDNALNAGSSMWSRHQKKMKEIKDKLNELEKENEELKKELTGLKSKKKKK